MILMTIMNGWIADFGNEITIQVSSAIRWDLLANPTQSKSKPSENPQHCNDYHYCGQPYAKLIGSDVVQIEGFMSAYWAVFIGKDFVHAATLCACHLCEPHTSTSEPQIVDHNPLEKVSLVVNIVEGVSPERVQGIYLHHEASCAHSKTIPESSGC